MADTNTGPSGHLTQEGRVAYDMSNTRRIWRSEAERLAGYKKRVAEAQKIVDEAVTEIPALEAVVQRALENHQAAMKVYTMSPWMDVQAKPKEEKAA